MMRRVAVCLLFALALCWAPRVARAQQADVSATVSANVVEVGEPFVVEMRAMTEDDTVPSDPQLQAPPGYQISGPSVGTRTMAHFGGGRSLIKRGISATWQLAASTPGRFTIPSPTVVVGGRTVTAAGSLRVRVVPAGTKPPSAGGSRSPFGGIFQFPFRIGDDMFEDELEDPRELSPEARKLALEREPDPHVFIRLMVDKESAVVGEQITLSYYVYFRTDLQLVVQREPSLADFLRVPIEKAPGTEEAIITAVADHRYHVKLLDRVAIFPLRAGKLDTGMVYAKFTGRRFGSRELERSSNQVTVDVREPPVEGRPLGYRIGDVGRYTLSANVTPRETRVGDTVAVEVRLSGRGSLPTTLSVPERTGVEWLAPERREEIDDDDGKVGGWRSFRYAVRLLKAGEIDLGEIELPYYDPERGAYDVARAPLGDVRVLPRADGAAAAPDDASSSEDPFASVAKPRQSLRDHDGGGDPGLSPAWLWTLVLVPPLGVALSNALWSAADRLRRRRRERRSDPGVLATRALGDVRRKEDPKDGAAAAERALHLAIEAATGIKSRGVLLGDLSERLTRAGLSEELVRETVELLEACSAVRFDPDPAGDAADRVIERTPQAVKRLLRNKPVAPARARAAAPEAV